MVWVGDDCADAVDCAASGVQVSSETAKIRRLQEVFIVREILACGV